MEQTKLCDLGEFIKKNKTYTPSGKRIVDVLEWDADHKHLVKTGERDVQEEYNAAAVGCGVYGIIDRILKGSAVEPPAPQDGQFMDVSGMSGTTSGEAFAAEKRLLQANKSKKAEKAEDKPLTPEELDAKLQDLLSQVEDFKKTYGGEN